MGWKRGQVTSIPAPAPQEGRSQTEPVGVGGKPFKRREPAPPRPTKVIANATEQLKMEVMSILNKITPQTFDKLTVKLCEVQVATWDHLEKLIELVFEKAIQEPNFANLYADMCMKLENQSRYWAFLQVLMTRASQ